MQVDQLVLWLRELQVNEQVVQTVEEEKLSGVDLAALSLEELETDLGCSKLQAKKIVNRIAQQRQHPAAPAADSMAGLVPLTSAQKDARRSSASQDWAAVLDDKPQQPSGSAAQSEVRAGGGVSEKEAKVLRKLLRDLKRKKKEATGPEKDKLKKEISKLEAQLEPDAASTVDYSEYSDVSGDGGVLVKLIKPGSGFSPTALSKVEVHFIGKIQGGDEFHSTHASGHPVSFLLGTSATIKGLEQALLTMKAGARALVVIAPEYAYGNKGRAPHDDEPEVTPGATLEYELELISFQAKPGTAASEAVKQTQLDLERLKQARQGRNADDALPAEEAEEDEEEFPALGGKKPAPAAPPPASVPTEKVGWTAAVKKEKKSEREKGTPKAGASGGEEAGAGRGRSRSVSVNISSPANSAARAEEERRQQERRRTRSVSVAGKNPQTPKTPQVMERDTDIINMDSLSLDANTDDSDAQMAALAADGVDTHKLTSRPPPPIKFNLASALKKSEHGKQGESDAAVDDIWRDPDNTCRRDEDAWRALAG